MKLNREVLISAILRHQQVFLQLLDCIDAYAGSNEFPESDYLRLYNTYISKDDDINIINQLAPNSLLENGVFIHNNRSSGTITVERVIIDLLRFVDVKRRRELTAADFEAMRIQLHHAVERLSSCAFGDTEYRESMQTVNQIIAETHSKIRTNVDSLTAQVGTIADRYKNYQEQQGADDVFELYQAISQLYERYVLPCLEFISPDMQMVQTRTFSQCMDALIHYHSERYGQNKIAHEISYRKTAITSYFKDIGELAGRLEVYAKFIDRDRQQFLAVEKAFNGLEETAQPLRHGKRRSRLLTHDLPFFAQFQSFAGLRNSRASFAPRLNWSEKFSPLQVAEYLRSIEQLVRDQPPAQPLKPVAAAPDASLQRQQQIATIVDQLLTTDTAVQRGIRDIYAYLDGVLRDKLNDYSLVDTLYGYHSFLAFVDMSEDLLPISYTGTRNRLEDAHYYFDYLIPAICPASTREMTHV